MKRLLFLTILCITCIMMCTTVLASDTSSIDSSDSYSDVYTDGYTSTENIGRFDVYSDFYEDKYITFDSINLSKDYTFDSSYAVGIEKKNEISDFPLRATYNGKLYEKKSDGYYEVIDGDYILVTDEDLIAELDNVNFESYSLLSSFNSLHVRTEIILPNGESFTLENGDIISFEDFYYPNFYFLFETDGFSYVARWWLSLIITIVCILCVVLVPLILIIFFKKSRDDEEDGEEEYVEVSKRKARTESVSASEFESGYVNLSNQDDFTPVYKAKRKKHIFYIDYFLIMHILIVISAVATAIMFDFISEIKINSIIAASVSFVFVGLTLFIGIPLLRYISVALAFLCLSDCIIRLFWARNMLVWGYVFFAVSAVILIALALVAFFKRRRANTPVVEIEE